MILYGPLLDGFRQVRIECNLVRWIEICSCTHREQEASRFLTLFRTITAAYMLYYFTAVVQLFLLHSTIGTSVRANNYILYTAARIICVYKQSTGCIDSFTACVYAFCCALWNIIQSFADLKLDWTILYIYRSTVN